MQSLALQTKDIILEDIEDTPLGTSQLEINDTKEYWRKQINHAVTTYKEPSGSLLEDNVWAPNENLCEKLGLYKAKTAAVSLLGNSKEEHIKFVEGTIYRNKHISKIEKCFIKGNSWVVISFDCLKGLKSLKEKLEKKEIE